MNRLMPLIPLAYRDELERIRQVCDATPGLQEELPALRLSGRPLTYFAAQSGKTRLLQWLLGRGFDANEPCGEGGLRLLHFAVAQWNAPMVRLLLAYGAEVDGRSAQGATPLMNVVQSGSDKKAEQQAQRIEVSEQLLDAGADINAQDNSGNTVLHFCAESMNAELFLWLVKHGADTGLTNLWGKTPYQYGTEAFTRLLRSTLTENEFAGLFSELGRVVPPAAIPSRARGVSL